MFEPNVPERLLAVGERMAADPDFMLGLAGAVGGTFAVLVGVLLVVLDFGIPVLVAETVVSVGAGLAVGVPVVFWFRQPIDRING